MTLHQAARRYHELGFHPIPCRPRSKVPTVAWKDFQTIQPTLEQINAWWTEDPQSNVALVLGRGTFAVDLDGGMDAERLLHEAGVDLPAEAPRSKTANGFHVLLSSYTPVGDRVGLLSTNGAKPQVDIRGVGIIVAPPSIHPSGATYEWQIKPTGQRPPAAPQSLLGLLAQTPHTAPGPQDGPAKPSGVDSWVSDLIQGVPEGARNAACTRLAGYFLSKQMPDDIVEHLLCASFARNCVPAFPEREVVACVRSVARRENVAHQSVTPAVQTIGQALDALVAEIDKGGAVAVGTPFPTLTRYLEGGFAPGQLILLGARPGQGKTAMALECGRQAGKHRRSVLIISREMTNVALARRLVAQDARIPASALRRADLDNDASVALYQSLNRLRQLPIYLTDQAVSLDQIAALVASMSALGLVIVDYLQLVRAPREIKERRLQVEHVSSSLKTLALTYQVPVLCLSSLNRPPDGRPQRPTLASLRESGELEHDADVVLLLHREDDNAPDTECIVAKNREGRTGSVDLYFRGDYVAFDEADRLAGVM